MQLSLPLWAASGMEASWAPGQTEKQELHCAEDEHIRALRMGPRNTSGVGGNSGQKIQWPWGSTFGKVACGDTG